SMLSRRALGQWLTENIPHGGGRPRKNGDIESEFPQTLEQLKIPEKESERSQLLAAIPDEALASAIEAIEANEGELITRDFIELGKLYKRMVQEKSDEEDAREEAAAKAEEDRQVKRVRGIWKQLFAGYFAMRDAVEDGGPLDEALCHFTAEEKAELHTSFRM